MKVFTIGFTQKTAEDFFEKIRSSGTKTLIDVRLNNKSQLAGFAKYPDIQFFLCRLCSVNYIHDTLLAPGEQLLKNYRAGRTSWDEYETEFAETMQKRNIKEHIMTRYRCFQSDSVCLLCSEPTPEHCHRRLVADIFRELFAAEIYHL